MAINPSAKPQPGVSTAGTGLAILVPLGGIADLTKPKVSELSASTAIDITYMLTGDGLERTSSQEMIDDPRWTLAQSTKLPGIKTDEVSLTYPFTGDSARKAGTLDGALIEGEEYTLVIRSALPRTAALAAGQPVDVIPVKVGRKAKNAAAANSVWTKTVNLAVTGEVGDDIALVA